MSTPKRDTIHLTSKHCRANDGRKDRKATLQAHHTDSVNKAVKSQERNVVLHGRPLSINNSEKDLTRQERSTLVQLRSGYCRLLGFYKCRIKKDASLNICAYCGMTPHNIKTIKQPLRFSRNV